MIFQTVGRSFAGGESGRVGSNAQVDGLEFGSARAGSHLQAADESSGTSAKGRIRPAIRSSNPRRIPSSTSLPIGATHARVFSPAEASKNYTLRHFKMPRRHSYA